MKHLIVLAALLLCSNAQAATYVYQAKAYQGHAGRCGGKLLPFQLTITVSQAIPPNSSNLTVPLQTISINAGGKYQWEREFNKKDTDNGQFTTDLDGDITAWIVAGGTTHRRLVFSQNQIGNVQDSVRFKCGSAGGEGNPGKWKQEE
jgi:hypothetical protein